MSSISAQEHLTFKGIPLDGNLSTFVGKLKADGCNLIYSNDNAAILSGNFSGEERKIVIYASKSTKTVYQAVVLLEISDSWSLLKNTYNDYKNILTSKYGKGESCQFFSNPYYDGDGYEMTAIRASKCTYYTEYKLTNGTILLIITDISGGTVALSYSDTNNETIADREKETLITNDL